MAWPHSLDVSIDGRENDAERLTPDTQRPIQYHVSARPGQKAKGGLVSGNLEAYSYRELLDALEDLEPDLRSADGRTLG